MKTPPTWLLVMAALWCSSFRGAAEVVTFTLDPARSSITVTGRTSTAVYQDQGPGSRSGRFAGTLNVDVKPNSIEFKPGSFIDAITNGVWAPQTNGADGTAPADFAAQAALFGGLTTARAALRELVVDATSSVIPLQGTSFNSSGIIFQFPTNGTASLDYRVTGVGATQGTKKLESIGTNDVTTTGSLINQGGTETLTLPVHALFTLELLSPGDTVVGLLGTLVATRSAPPPLVFDAHSLSLTPTSVNLQWQGPANQTFRIESTTNLVNWSDRATGITSTTTSYSWDGTRAGPNEFFRLAQ